jgi:hypothetical protein
VSFGEAAQSGSEGAGTLTVVAELDTASGLDVQVPFTLGGTATEGVGQDYTITLSPVTIAAGSLSENIVITVNDDSLDENGETVVVTMGTPVNGTQGTPSVHTATITDNDAQPEVSFSEAAQSGAEGAGTLTVVAELDTASGLDVDVPFTMGGTAAEGGGQDYTITASPVTIAAGSTSENIVITLNDDGLYELPETVVVTMGTPVNATKVAPSVHTATITDNDAQPEVSFSEAAQSGAEGAGTLTVVAELDTLSGADVEVPFTLGGTAAEGVGQDYTIMASPVTIAAGSLSENIEITVNDDSLDEDDETVVVTMGTPVNATLGTPSVHTATITDNDPEPDVDFSSPSQIGWEHIGAMTIDVVLSAASGRDVVVPFGLTGTATQGEDYTVVQNPVTIPAGSLSSQIVFAVDDDPLDEFSEDIVVTMQQPANGQLGDSTLHTATILDNDLLPEIDFSLAEYSVAEAGLEATITVILAPASGRTVTVDYASTDGTATAGSDYTAVNDTLTFAPGVTEQTFIVEVDADLLDEEDEEDLTLELSGPDYATFPPAGSRNTPATLIILDSDPLPTVDFNAVSYSEDEDDVVVPIGVTLSPPSGRTVTVEYASSPGTATPDSDYTEVNGTVTFDPSEFWQTFDLPIAEDTLDEIAETIQLTLSSASNANIGGNSPATFTIQDDDVQPDVDFAEASYSIEENDTSAVITVTLSAASGQIVTVNYATDEGSATEGADYSDVAGVLTFLPGDVSESFPVPISEDSLNEGTETVTLELSGAVNAGLGDINNPAILTITDDDPEPTLAFSLPEYSVEEEDTSVWVTVELSAPSGRTVSVDYAGIAGTATAGTDYTLVDATLTFDPEVVAQSFAVPILEDLLNEDDETIFLTLSAPLNAGIAGTNPVTLTISDDDPLPIVDFDSSSYGADEGNVSVLVTVTLDAASGRTVTVDYASSDVTAAAGSDYTGVGDTLTFLPLDTSETFEVPVLGDDVDEDDETLLLTLSGVTNAEFPGSANNPVTFTIFDDDVAGIVVSPTLLTVTEAPGDSHSDAFTITLTSSPAAPVIVTVQSTDESECTVSPPAVSLTGANWDSGFKVTVTAEDDTQQDGAQECLVLTGDATSADDIYAGMVVSDVTATVLDNDVVYQAYLPLLMRDWPPAPEIDPILGAENGSFAVTWGEVVDATSYVLEEAKRSDFGDAVVVLDGTSRFYSVTGAGAGRRYYRARARGPWGEGRWSDSAWADVLWEAEPNDVGGPGGQSNGPIVPDLIYLGEMPSGADERDYYYFYVSGPQTVDIWLTDIPAGQNYDLALRSGAQWPTAIVWSVKGGNADEYVRANGLATGTYYIQIFNTGGGGSTEEYHLRMAFP